MDISRVRAVQAALDAEYPIERNDGLPSRFGPIRIADIVRATCSRMGVSRLDLMSERRSAVFVLARQVAMFLARDMTLLSLPQIGRFIGDRDHTTVIHSFRKIERLISEGHDVGSDVVAIRSALTG